MHRFRRASKPLVPRIHPAFAKHCCQTVFSTLQSDMCMYAHAFCRGVHCMAGLCELHPPCTPVAVPSLSHDKAQSLVWPSGQNIVVHRSWALSP